jgi:PP-loop superfamily ATP-utilizing enzyme
LSIPLVFVSGGCDSTALALLLWERGESFEMLFSDTDAELPGTYELLVRLAKTIQRPLRIVNGPGLWRTLIAHNWILPGPRCRWCTRLLKKQPTDRYTIAVGAEYAAIGIRGDELRRVNAARRQKYEVRFPLAEAGLGKKDARRLCCRYGLLHPAYSWRSNLSCFCCFFQRVSDWRGLLEHHPRLFAIAEGWERRRLAETGRTWTLRRPLSVVRRIEELQLNWEIEHEEGPCFYCGV